MEQETLDELKKLLETAIKDAFTLQITTIVGDIKVDPSGEPKPDPANSKTMFTKIDLVDGDIVSMIDNAFLTGNLAEIREYHADREKQAHEIIRANIETLKELAAFVQELTEPSAEEPGDGG